MKLNTIEFASGHQCVDNGRNDYDLICPVIGGAVRFLPCLIARTLSPSSRCPHCAQPLGERESMPKPEPERARARWEILVNNATGEYFGRRTADGFTISLTEYGNRIPDHLL